MKIWIISGIGLLALFFAAPWVLQAKADPYEALPTTFSYCQKELEKSRSPHLITLERIDKWDEALRSYFREKQIPYSRLIQFYTYLYLVQRDAAFLSYNVHHCFVGSLDPLVKEVITAFFPGFTAFSDYATDPYSEELAVQVWPPYAKRLKQEALNSSVLQPCGNSTLPKSIESVGKWIPWITPLPSVPPPQKEEPLPPTVPTAEEEQAMHAWAEKKNWVDLANHYIEREAIPIGKALFARSVLMIGLFDAHYAVMRAKYAYCVPRPSDPLIRKPLTPAYPSGHAAHAGTAAWILSYFFPKAAEMWEHNAYESAMSRVWGRVHTLQEVEVGLELGKEVGEGTLRSLDLHGQAREAPERRCPFSGQSPVKCPQTS